MENLDLIILTIIVVIVYGVFSVSLLKSFGSKDGIKEAKINARESINKQMR